MPALRGARSQTASRPPNILYIHSHDSGRCLFPYGFPVPTPSIVRLASDGALFRQAFSAAPTCLPSRAALLRGQCAHSHGMLGLAHRGFRMTDHRHHILHTLRPAGYTSVLAGLQHIARRADMIGYDEILQLKSHRALHVAPSAVQFLRERPTRPFFLDVGFFETHRKFPPGKKTSRVGSLPH